MVESVLRFEAELRSAKVRNARFHTSGWEAFCGEVDALL